ncbi:hypothetical protein ScPMuIL_006741 [Solemya velum]
MPRRRKEELLSDGEDGQLPVQRNAANARERARMRVLSKAFVKLKTTLPWVPSDTKLSKLDTLRLAASYIAHLRQVLEAEDEDITEQAYVHPINLTWPFTFNGKIPLIDGKPSDQIILSPMKRSEVTSEHGTT